MKMGTRRSHRLVLWKKSYEITFEREIDLRIKEDLERLFHFLRLDGKKQSQDDHVQYSKQSDCQLNTQVGDVRVQIGSHIVAEIEKKKKKKEKSFFLFHSPKFGCSFGCWYQHWVSSSGMQPFSLSETRVQFLNILPYCAHTAEAHATLIQRLLLVGTKL